MKRKSKWKHPNRRDLAILAMGAVFIVTGASTVTRAPMFDQAAEADELFDGQTAARRDYCEFALKVLSGKSRHTHVAVAPGVDTLVMAFGPNDGHIACSFVDPELIGAVRISAITVDGVHIPDDEIDSINLRAVAKISDATR